LENFEILDRWGEILFKTNDKNIGWDGTYKSQKVEPGIYVYKIAYTCKGEEFTRSGNFVLLK
jgi:gliding motility-associated-like protein